MGNRSSLLLREEEIAQIQEETGCKFTFTFSLGLHLKLSCIQSEGHLGYLNQCQ